MATAVDRGQDHALLVAMEEDHWTMAILFQRLSEGLADGLDQAVLVTILNSLTTLFADHAAREEAYLARIGHGDLARHKTEHADAITHLRSVLKDCAAGMALTRSQLSAISDIFTGRLSAGDRRDGLSGR